MADAADCQCDHKPDGRYPSAAENRNFSCTAPLQGKRLSVYPVFPSDENRKLPGTLREIFTAGGTLYLALTGAVAVLAVAESGREDCRTHPRVKYKWICCKGRS